VIRSTRPRLYDIDQNITLVLDVTKRRSHENLQHDMAFRYTILHALMIIAEAVHYLPADITAQHPGVPWPKIVGIGNMIKHEYHRVDTLIVWEVVTVHLKPLHVAVKKLLADLEQPVLPL
jgi:uncharacterized protein with HEPN domain